MNRRRRSIEEFFFKSLMKLAVAVSIFAFFIILITIFVKGFPALSFKMIFTVPQGGFYIGEEGGILNAVMGSLYIAGGACILGFLISLPVMLYLHVYLKKNSWLAHAVRLSSDVLFGIPSIVYGAFGFTVMIFFGMKTSLLAGILAVTLLVIPIMIRTMDEAAQTVPRHLLEAAYSLGITRLEASGIVVKQIASGIFTAILLSFGRAIGDAAAVLLTAGFSDHIPTRFNEPAATLPLAIFFQLSSPSEKVQQRAYAAAAILTFIVLAASISGRLLSKRFSEHRV